jgi:hypothetical protein
MLPFYFLSIVFNALAGYILAFGKEETDDAAEAGFRLSFNNETFRLVLGVGSLAIGFLKILSPVQGNIPVVGDLVPALTGLAVGFILVFEYYRNRASLESEQAEKVETLIKTYRKLLGFGALGAAVLHFLLYSVPLL